MSTIIDFPQKTKILFPPSRYKVLYGGRGGGKSHSIAAYLLLEGMKNRHRILCCREFQNSISESVHKLFSDLVRKYEFQDFYDIQKTSILGKNGTEFHFAGLRHNINSIKSFEGCSKVWVEEAQNVSKSSWDILIPTIRLEDSEIIISFNPELTEDETYQRFVKHPPRNAVVAKINWDDNPFFPNVLREDMEALRLRDEDAYNNIWLGFPRETLEGAIYAKELREAQQHKRIMRVPYVPTLPVHVFCDLGWADNTCLWFVQKVGFEYRIIRAYQNNQQPWHHYMQYMQAQGYIFDTIWLPHDARAKSLGTGRSIEELTKTAGYRVRIVPNLSVEDGINAVRTIFPVLYFDEDNCADGLHALRRYRYDVDIITGQFSRKPLHDDASHFADGLRYFAVGMSDKAKGKIPEPKTIQISRGGMMNQATWMK